MCIGDDITVDVVDVVILSDLNDVGYMLCTLEMYGLIDC